MIRAVEHLLCLLAIYISSLDQRLFKSFGFIFHDHMLLSCFVPGILASSTDTLQHLTSLQRKEGLLFLFYRWGNWGSSHALQPRKGRRDLRQTWLHFTEWRPEERHPGGETKCIPGLGEMVFVSYASSLCLLQHFPSPLSSFPSLFSPFRSKLLNVSSLPVKIW